MNNIFISILSMAFLISCEKHGDLKFSEAIQGGCFLEKGITTEKSQTSEKDTVYYSVTGDNLVIFLGFNATCCEEYVSNAIIKGDSILIDVESSQIGICNCICYYTCDFKFIGTGKNYSYNVKVDDFLRFTGKIEP